MPQEIACFLFCKEEVSTKLLAGITRDLQINACRIGALDGTIHNRFVTTKNGCVVISDEKNDQKVNDLIDFFLANHVWLPIVCFTPNSDSARPAGSFAAANKVEDLLQQIRSALQCDLSGGFAPAEFRRRHQSLTKRETEAMDLFLKGQNTKAVAKNLGVTYQTVDKHRGRALKKFGVATVVDLQIALQRTMLTSMGVLTPLKRTDAPSDRAPVATLTPHFSLAGSTSFPALSE